MYLYDEKERVLYCDMRCLSEIHQAFFMANAMGFVMSETYFIMRLKEILDRETVGLMMPLPYHNPPVKIQTCGFIV